MAEAKTKPGYKTTEFWMSAVVAVMGLVTTSGAMDGLGADHWAVKAAGMVAAVLAALGYTAARAKTKAEE